MFWQSQKVDFTVVSFFRNCICGDVQILDRVMWRLIGIYGWPDMENKYKTWDLIRSLCNYKGPLLLGGDFNESSYDE